MVCIHYFGRTFIYPCIAHIWFYAPLYGALECGQSGWMACLVPDLRADDSQSTNASQESVAALKIRIPRLIHPARKYCSIEMWWMTGSETWRPRGRPGPVACSLCPCQQRAPQSDHHGSGSATHTPTPTHTGPSTLYIVQCAKVRSRINNLTLWPRPQS